MNTGPMTTDFRLYDLLKPDNDLRVGEVPLTSDYVLVEFNGKMVKLPLPSGAVVQVVQEQKTQVLLKPYCGHFLSTMVDEKTNEQTVMCPECQEIYGQCSKCELWFPRYDPRSEGATPTHCNRCGGDELHYSLIDNLHRCLNCDNRMEKIERAPCLDGADESGERWCIFCDDPDGDNSHATPGVKL